MALINFPSLLAISLLLSSPLLALALRRPVRSVIECDRLESSVVESARKDNCKDYCRQIYVNAHRDLRQANKDLLQAKLEFKPATRIDGTPIKHVPSAQEVHCCCSFEAPWPTFVDASLIGRESDEAQMKHRAKHNGLTCLPLAMGTVFLSERTRRSYETLCKYLDATKPMTILELMQFTEAAKYLNYMQPKHPAINLLLREKQVQRIQKEEFQELQDVLNDYLLDNTYKWRAWADYPGYHLDTNRFKRIAEMRSKLKSALKSSLVSKAIDELAISQVVVDVAAASVRVSLMNANEFRIPENLLGGDYDRYYMDLDNYFRLPGLKCDSLRAFTKQVALYLSQMKSLLYTLHEKLVYDHMTLNSQDLKKIVDSHKIYEHLLDVNCKKE